MVVAMTDCKGCKHENECNYNKRYDFLFDWIVDYQTDKEYNSFKEISELLNEKEETIQEYKHLVKIATSLIEWNTIPQVRREWKKHLSKVGDD